MLHAVVSGLILFAVWLLWSGLSTPGTEHFHLMLFNFGLVSCAVTVWLSRRMGVLDSEGQPHHLVLRILRYLPWLAREIVVANLDVTRRVLSPSRPISPTLVELEVGQRTDLGRVIYADSITLTPGTISLFFDAENRRLVVHSLSREGAEDLEAGEMNRRVCRLEGSAG